jgi:hypothetical protein
LKEALIADDGSRQVPFSFASIAPDAIIVLNV